jgi:acetyltransferase-like isoleucine patch superfamily enzyme/SAM-dependent methyltransferase
MSSISGWVGLRDEVMSGWFNRATGELAKGFPVSADDIVLDVGCGEGGKATFSAERGAHLILCDIDPRNIAAARARLSAFPGLRLDTYVTDGNPLPLADGTATRIVCTEVLEHVEDPAALLAEMVRVGQPGALYLISVPATVHELLQKKLARPEYFEKPSHIRIFQPGEMAELIGNAGLTLVDTSKFGFFRALWLAFFWQCDIPASELANASHPTLDSWAQTWNQVLAGRDGALIQAALNKVLPKSELFIAQKPNTASVKSDSSLFGYARQMTDGQQCSDRMLDRLAVELGQRLVQVDFAGMALPRWSDLRVRRQGMPDWWNQNDNVCLAAPGAVVPEMHKAFFCNQPVKNSLLVMGEGSRIRQIEWCGDGSYVGMGDHAIFFNAAIAVQGHCTVLIGEACTAMAEARIEARNGGLVYVGADGMWADDVHVLTDDMHAIRDLQTGQRINPRGGQVVIGPHVWLGMEVRICGNVHIGGDSVVGMGSLVRNTKLPPNAVSAGRPARVIRTGITWSREDLP